MIPVSLISALKSDPCSPVYLTLLWGTVFESLHPETELDLFHVVERLSRWGPRWGSPSAELVHVAERWGPEVETFRAHHDDPEVKLEQALMWLLYTQLPHWLWVIVKREWAESTGEEAWRITALAHPMDLVQVCRNQEEALAA